MRLKIATTANKTILRAGFGRRNAVRSEALKDLFLSGDVTIEDTVPGRDVDASIETLKMLTSFGTP